MNSLDIPPQPEEPAMGKHKYDCPLCHKKDVPIRVDGRMAEHHRAQRRNRGNGGKCSRGGTLPVDIFEKHGPSGVARAIAEAIRESRDQN